MLLINAYISMANKVSTSSSLHGARAALLRLRPRPSTIDGQKSKSCRAGLTNHACRVYIIPYHDTGY